MAVNGLIYIRQFNYEKLRRVLIPFYQKRLKLNLLHVNGGVYSQSFGGPFEM